MEWFVRRIAILRHFFRPNNKQHDFIKLDIGTPSFRKRQVRKIPFYAHIPTPSIRKYQMFINRAFAISPSLDFAVGNIWYEQLLEEATCDEDVSVLDFEMMRVQYLLADPRERRKHKKTWAVRVINQRDPDFFPSPWAILATTFQTAEGPAGAHVIANRKSLCA